MVTKAVLIKPDEGWEVGADGAQRGKLRGFELYVYLQAELADPDGLMVVSNPKFIWYWEVRDEDGAMVGNGCNQTESDARVEAMCYAWRRGRESEFAVIKK